MVLIASEMISIALRAASVLLCEHVTIYTISVIHVAIRGGGGKREKTASRALVVAREKRTVEVKKTARDYASARFLEAK